jgi:hypothetical protein
MPRVFPRRSTTRTASLPAFSLASRQPDAPRVDNRRTPRPGVGIVARGSPGPSRARALVPPVASLPTPRAATPRNHWTFPHAPRSRTEPGKPGTRERGAVVPDSGTNRPERRRANRDGGANRRARATRPSWRENGPRTARAVRGCQRSPNPAACGSERHSARNPRKRRGGRSSPAQPRPDPTLPGESRAARNLGERSSPARSGIAATTRRGSGANGARLGSRSAPNGGAARGAHRARRPGERRGVRPGIRRGFAPSPATFRQRFRWESAARRRFGPRVN